MFTFNPTPKKSFLKEKPMKICVCGKEFIVKPCHLNDPNRKYCSNECRFRNARTPKTATYKNFICSTCNTPFSLELGKGGGTSKYSKRYCSLICKFKGQKRAVLVSCTVCEIQFEKQLSKLNVKKNFCSRQCHKKWCKDNPPPPGLIKSVDNKGSKNGQFKHGRYAGRDRSGGDSGKKKVREIVKTYDGNWCFLCGKPGPGLHLHRVIYGSQGGKYEVDNCILLCAVDHEKVHSSKLKWEPILLSHVNERKRRTTRTIS